jgi:hypothetical protein
MAPAVAPPAAVVARGVEAAAVVTRAVGVALSPSSSSPHAINADATTAQSAVAVTSRNSRSTMNLLLQ